MTAPGRYQTAFGHRRVRVAGLLGRTVKAIVRALSDDELVVAQGLENSAREDLSFIERAVFALRLETSGRSRSIIQQALAKDGSFTGKPNGKWDSSTVDAMKRFQETHGLSATGKLDAKTLQQLGLGSSIAGVAAPQPSASSTKLTAPSATQSARKQ